MSVVATATAIVQLVAVGKELVDLWNEGELTDEELERRWNANVESLSATEARWRARQRQKQEGQST